MMFAELTAKRLELVSELVPQTKVVALLVNPNNPNADHIIGDVREAAREKGLRLHVLRLTFGRQRPILPQPVRSARGADVPPCRPDDL